MTDTVIRVLFARGLQRLLALEKTVKLQAARLREAGPKGDPGEKGDKGLDGQSIKGDKGDPGEKGDKGLDGQSIKGDPGPRGPRGEKGKDGVSIKGERGQRGEKGEKGEKGERGPKPDHRWKGTSLQFEKPDGTWGKLVDLKGDKGKPGTGGGAVFIGGGGGNTPDPSPELIDDDVVSSTTTYSSEKIVSLLGAPSDGVLVLPAGMTLSGNRVVRAQGGTAVIADHLNEDDIDVLGITQHAAATGTDVRIQTDGPMTEPGWSWTPDLPVFLGESGALTQTPPTSGFSLLVGVAITPTKINIGLQMPTYLE